MNLMMVDRTQMMKPKKMCHSKYNDQSKLNTLTNIVIDNIDSVYEYFDVDYRHGPKVIISRCFIHGGDNNTALNLYHNADYRIHYKCRTHSCENIFGTSLLSMIRGGLSHVKYNWSVPGDKTVSFTETIEFLLERFGLDFYNLKSSATFNDEKTAFCKIVNCIDKNKKKNKGFEREFYRSRVEIPSQYYLNRGYSIEILDEYDVGICKSYGKQMYNRSLVPVYDDDGKYIIGFSGRSIFEKCKECGSYHDPKKECHYFPKWKHSKGFHKEGCLYNYWKAKDYIKETGTIILVESPGNVWRLEEAGIHNSVALFGTVLSEEQKQLIDESGALTIVLIMDNDDNNAGQKAAQTIKKQCEKTYRVFIVDIEKNDVGNMSTNEISKDIKPFIDKIMEVYV